MTTANHPIGIQHGRALHPVAAHPGGPAGTGAQGWATQAVRVPQQRQAGTVAPGRRGRAVRVLVVDHDAQEGEALVRDLTRQGYAAERVGAGSTALKTHQSADFVLLALELPDIDGLEVCRGIRASTATPIIAVTAGCSELDRVLGLQAGADDCLARPYGLRELLARMEAVLRRVRPEPSRSDTISHGPLHIDTARREVRVDDRVVRTTRKEFELLHRLASQPDAVVSREQLMSEVWNDTWSASQRTLDTHVSSLRGKLGASSWIITVRGIGFRLGHR